jgi:hypothetical protein
MMAAIADAELRADAARLRAKLKIAEAERDLAIEERNEVRALLDDLIEQAFAEEGA